MTKKNSVGTLCVQAGYNPGNGEPRQIPIVQSTTFKYSSSDQMGRLFDLEDSGYFYTRLQNPTNDAVAAKIAALEGGVAAMLTSSGQSANFFACFNICEAGDHMISTASIYGGTFNLFGVTFKKMGIDVTFVDQNASEEEIAAAFRPNTKLVFGETLSNPGVRVLDIEKLARVAHSHGVPLIIDNTFPTPVNCRPFEWGADIVTHSTTKYMDGHGVGVGGVIVDSGNFDWEANAEKFPGLCTPDESYHGLTYTKKFGRMAYITKATSQLMRDLGAIQSPQNAFYLNLGLQSLAVRVKRHNESALKVAKFLEANPLVKWVRFPDLESDPDHALAQKYLPGGSCGVMSFAIEGGREFANRFMDSLKLVTIETHVADCYTCILHPASHTHRQLSDEQLREAGVDPDLMRLSIGLEDADDLIADITAALEAAASQN
ncbi:MAG: O-acetylhomoserine aminocarboxypropyltransferase/cysteine synthase [Bacteroidales bacterium]|nr:O-acetylhomoserine aminocarboxypropyltransferase/cysteine synthase [Bacteroidales bacterium]